MGVIPRPHTSAGLLNLAAQSTLTHMPVTLVEFSSTPPSGVTTSTAATESEQVSFSWAIPAQGTMQQ